MRCSQALPAPDESLPWKLRFCAAWDNTANEAACPGFSYFDGLACTTRTCLGLAIAPGTSAKCNCASVSADVTVLSTPPPAPPPPRPPPPPQQLVYGDVVAQSTDGAPVSGSLLANGPTFTDGTVVTVSTFFVLGTSTTYTPGPTPVPVIDAATGTVTGTIVILANGTYTFTPDPAYEGLVPPVIYILGSADGRTNPSSLLLEVQPGAKPCVCPSH